MFEITIVVSRSVTIKLEIWALSRGGYCSSTNDIRNRDFDILILKTTPRACGGRILLSECFLTFSIDKRESLYR